MESCTPGTFSENRNGRNPERVRRNIFPNSKSSNKKLPQNNSMDRVGRKLANTVTNRFSIYDAENLARNAVLPHQNKKPKAENPVHQRAKRSAKRDKSPREPQTSLYFYKNRYKYPPRSPRTRRTNRVQNIQGLSGKQDDRKLKRRFSFTVKLGGDRRRRDQPRSNKIRDQTSDKVYCSDADFYAAQVWRPQLIMVCPTVQRDVYPLN